MQNLITVTAADGTTSQVEGIALGEFHSGVDTFIIIDASNNVVAYRQPSADATQTTAQAVAAQAATDAGVETAEDAADAAAQAAVQAGWKFDPNTGLPLATAPPAPVNPAPVA